VGRHRAHREAERGRDLLVRLPGHDQPGDVVLPVGELRRAPAALRTARRQPQSQELHHVPRALHLHAGPERRAHLVAPPQLANARVLVTELDEDVGQPAAQARGVVNPWNPLQVLDGLPDERRRLRVVLLQPREDALAGPDPDLAEAVPEPVRVAAHALQQAARALRVPQVERGLRGDGQQGVDDPDGVPRAIGHREPLLAHLHRLGVVAVDQVVAGQPGEHGDLGVDLDGAAPRGARHTELPGLVEVSLRDLELTARGVEAGHPVEQPREQRALVQGARHGNRALRERDPGVPVPGAERVLHRHLVGVHAHHR